MRYRTAGLIAIAIILAMTASAIWAWMHAEDVTRVAVHFGPNGEPNGWMPAPLGWFIMPLIAVIALAILAAVPLLDKRVERSAKAYGAVCIAALGVLAVGHLTIIAPAIGFKILVPRALTFATGVLFAVMGNLFGKVRYNGVFGIRTPWTLQDEWVWDQTHRFGGRVFVIAGIALLFAAFAPVAGRALTRTMIAIVLAAVLLTYIKSYLLWREREARG